MFTPPRSRSHSPTQSLRPFSRLPRRTNPPSQPSAPSPSSTSIPLLHKQLSQGRCAIHFTEDGKRQPESVHELDTTPPQQTRKRADVIDDPHNSPHKRIRAVEPQLDAAIAQNVRIEVNEHLTGPVNSPDERREEAEERVFNSTEKDTETPQPSAEHLHATIGALETVPVNHLTCESDVQQRSQQHTQIRSGKPTTKKDTQQVHSELHNDIAHKHRNSHTLQAENKQQNQKDGANDSEVCKKLEEVHKEVHDNGDGAYKSNMPNHVETPAGGVTDDGDRQRLAEMALTKLSKRELLEMLTYRPPQKQKQKKKMRSAPCVEKDDANSHAASAQPVQSASECPDSAKAQRSVGASVAAGTATIYDVEDSCVEEAAHVDQHGVKDTVEETPQIDNAEVQAACEHPPKNRGSESSVGKQRPLRAKPKVSKRARSQTPHESVVVTGRSRRLDRYTSRSHVVRNHPSHKQGISTGIWLDLLPPEVCTRIAAYVGKFPKRDTLHLAESSKKQAEGVMSCVQYKLDLTSPGEVPNLNRWEEVFSSAVREIRYTDPAWPASPFLFRASTLTNATVAYGDQIFESLRLAPQLRSLTICFDGKYSPRALMTGVSNLKLDHLCLSCRYCDLDMCAITNLARSRRGRRGFASLTNLRSLELSCDRDWDEGSADLEIAPLIKALPNVREVATNCAVDLETAQLLAQIESVKLHRVPDAVNTAMKIGKAVTALSCPMRLKEFLRKSDVANLSACPRLTELALNLEHGAESELLSIVKNLRVLRLFWRWDKVYKGTDTKIFKAQYYIPPEGTSWRIVQNATHLEELVLHGMPLRAEEVTKILSKTGPKLQRFGMTIDTERYTSQEVLLTLMEGLRSYTPHLSYLDLKFNNDFQCMPGNSGPLWLNRLLLELRLLVRRLPILNVWELEDGIRRLNMPCQVSYGCCEH